MLQAIEAVATILGNTRTVCRKCYIHPAVIDSYMDGTLIKLLRQRAARLAQRGSGLGQAEAAVLTLLQKRLATSKAA